MVVAAFIILRAVADFLYYQSTSFLGLLLIFVKYLTPFILIFFATEQPPDKIKLWIQKLEPILLGVLFFNLILILYQRFYQPDILGLLGVDVSWMSTSSKEGRYIGVFRNVPEYGAFLVSTLLVAMHTRPPSKKISSLIILSIIFLSLVFSSSKVYIVVGFLFFLLQLKSKKNFLASLAFISIAALFARAEIFEISQRIFYYYSRFDFFFIDPDQFDIRLFAIFTSINILINVPFGLGIGRWGSYSAQFFSETQYFSFLKVSLTDGLLWHYIGELGIFAPLYLLYVAKRSKLEWKYLLPISLPLFTTMAFHDPGYSGLFFILVCLSRVKKFEKNISERI